MNIGNDIPLGVAQEIEHVKVNRRGIWLYFIRTNLFDFWVTQYEDEGLGLHEAYIGYDDEKAKQAFKRTVRKIMKESSL